MRYLGIASALIAAIVVLAGGGTGAAASAPVSVFPLPGTNSALPGTQITFRGISPGAIGSVQVIGSQTGLHRGHIAAHSDGQGGSFILDRPFSAGETVRVSTGLNVVGGTAGTFQFAVSVPAGPIAPQKLPIVSAGTNGVRHYRSRPDLIPATLTFTKRRAPASLGDIFLTPQFGPVQNGTMLLDNAGNLLWFHPVGPNSLASDFRVQQLWGHPVLTWWQGYSNNGSGRGIGEIFDQRYKQIATVRAGNGVQGMDLHEFLVTPQGQAWIIAVSPLHWPGVPKVLMDSVVQEIDIKTGLVMFEWHAIDHVPLSESYFTPARSRGVFDPYHMNSIAIDRDGNLIVSMRNTWGAYKIDRQSGNVIWTLGTNRNSFRMGPGTRTAFQHTVLALRDGTFMIFDDGGAPPVVHSQSRAIHVAINTSNMTVRLIKEYDHSPPLQTNFEGGAEPLPRGELFVGWGQQPYLTEFNAAGQIDFDAHFNSLTSSYRAYRMPWNGYPQTLPALATRPGRKGTTTVYASWNGATAISFWRVLAGPAANRLHGVGGGRKAGFESIYSVRSRGPCFAVQALTGKGQVLGTSHAIGSSRSCRG